MSADNGIFILHTKDGYRAAPSSMSIIEMIYNERYTNSVMKYVFGKSQDFKSLDEVIKQANYLHDDEYVTRFVEFPELDFPTGD